MKTTKIIFLIILVLLISFIFVSARSENIDKKTLLNIENKFKKLESKSDNFKRVEIGNNIVYFYEREINGITIEKDLTIYKFNKYNGKFLEKKSKSRSDLTELPEIKITKEQAESLVKGQIEFSKLYLISPESDVFPIKPTPTNPSWVVTSTDNGEKIITVIDAITGKILGYGITPPYNALSFSGPTINNPCDGAWLPWSDNARYWFSKIGYQTESILWPTKSEIKNHIQSHETAMFYEIAHGDSEYFANSCIIDGRFELTSARDIETWINDYNKMPFTFLASCDSMCNTADNTFSYEFRKGSNKNTAVVGYCGMATEYCISSCWVYSLDWQEALFDYLDQGYTIEEAYDLANADFPQCTNSNGNCMRFEGDPNLKVKPIVSRDPATKVVSKTLPSGWNLISIPSEPVNKEPEVVFKDINIEGNLHKYDHKNLGYIAYHNFSASDFGPITRGESYWFNCINENGCDLTYNAYETNEDLEIGLPTRGWYLIGASHSDVNFENITVKKGEETKTFTEAANLWIQDPFNSYDSSAKGYFNAGFLPTDTDHYLRAWNGYWVYTFEDNLKLIISDSDIDVQPVKTTKYITEVKSMINKEIKAKKKSKVNYNMTIEPPTAPN